MIISYNNFINNSKYGVDIQTGYGITFRNNFIQNNSGGTSQAGDNSTDNNGMIWYDSDTKEGNFWDNWNQVGSYQIDGLVNSKDLYPLNASIILTQSSSTTSSKSTSSTTSSNAIVTESITSNISFNNSSDSSSLPYNVFNPISLFLLISVLIIREHKKKVY